MLTKNICVLINFRVKSEDRHVMLNISMPSSIFFTEGSKAVLLWGSFLLILF